MRARIDRLLEGGQVERAGIKAPEGAWPGPSAMMAYAGLPADVSRQRGPAQGRLDGGPLRAKGKAATNSSILWRPREPIGAGMGRVGS